MAKKIIAGLIILIALGLLYVGYRASKEHAVDVAEQQDLSQNAAAADIVSDDLAKPNPALADFGAPSTLVVVTTRLSGNVRNPALADPASDPVSSLLDPPAPVPSRF